MAKGFKNFIKNEVSKEQQLFSLYDKLIAKKGILGLDLTEMYMFLFSDRRAAEIYEYGHTVQDFHNSTFITGKDAIKQLLDLTDLSLEEIEKRLITLSKKNPMSKGQASLNLNHLIKTYGVSIDG